MALSLFMEKIRHVPRCFGYQNHTCRTVNCNLLFLAFLTLPHGCLPAASTHVHDFLCSVRLV